MSVQKLVFFLHDTGDPEEEKEVGVVGEAVVL